MAALPGPLKAQAAAAAGITPVDAALALCRARTDGRRVMSTMLGPRSRDEAYAIQDATLAAIGPIGGWKVAASGPGLAPVCAPLPAQGLLPGGAALRGSAWHLRMLHGSPVSNLFLTGVSTAASEPFKGLFLNRPDAIWSP